MTCREFFVSDSGKATLALVVAASFCIWPIMAGWLAASYLLSYAVERLRAAFRRLEAEEAEQRRLAEEADEAVLRPVRAVHATVDAASWPQ